VKRRANQLLILLGIKKRPGTGEVIVVPETMVDDALVTLTKRIPKTKAEREFHRWLSDWKKSNKEISGCR